MYADRLDEQVERLAHHAYRGELWEKATTYLRQAGTKALTRSSYPDAVACFEHALAAVRHLPERRETLAQAIDLHFDLRTSLFPLGEFERVNGYLREAERLARALDDPARSAWASAHISHYLWITGQPRQARSFVETAHTIAEKLGDLPLQVVSGFFVGMICHACGGYQEAEGFFHKTVQLLPGDLSRQRFGLAGMPAVLSHAWCASSLAERGAFSSGIAQGEDGIRIAEAAHHPYSSIIAYWGLGELYRVKGDLQRATALLERSLAIEREVKTLFLVPRVTGSLGHVYALAGRIAEGISLLQEARAAIEARGLNLYRCPVAIRLGSASLLAGRVEEARGLVSQALAWSRASGERAYEAYARRLLGEIASQPDAFDPGAAEDHCRQALALAEELAMRPLAARCRLGLGKLYRRTGDRAKARHELATALTMFREMDMRFWLELAETELRE